MIAAFVHELQFLEDDNHRLYLRGYNNSYWERYLRYFSTLYVVGRKKKASAEQVKGLDVMDDERIMFYEVPSIHSPKALLKNWKKADDLMEELVDKVDCVVTRQPGRYSDRVIPLCIKKQKPYLIEVVGCPWDSFWNHSFYGKIIAPGAVLRTKQFLRNAPFAVYVTERFLQNRYPTRGINTNCSNVTLPVQNIETLNRRKAHIAQFTDGHTIRIGTVAAVNVRYKGQQYIIQALAALKRQGKVNFEYHLVGGGEQTYLREVAEKYGVADQVIFHGPLTHDKVFDFLDEMDVYVQPSLQEGLPRALIEAMSRGLPCFGAHTGGIPELLDERYVFSNGRNRIKQICGILLNFHQASMLQQAERNYMEALKYEADTIDARRVKIFDEFVKTVK